MSNTAISLTIKKLNIYGTWDYKTENKDCSICMQSLQTPTQKSIREKKTNGSISVGLCNHGFHNECIDDWVSSDGVSCPICKTLWRPSKNTGGTVYLYNN